MRRAIVAVSAIVALHSARSQSLESTPTIAPAAVGESLKVLRRMAGVTRDHPADTASWYRRGMLAFALAMHARESGKQGDLDERLLRIEASDALHKALELDQNNPDLYFALGRFYGTARVDLLSGHKSRDLYEQAYERFITRADPALKVVLLLRMGDEDWYFYDKFEARAMELGHAARTVSAAAGRDTLSSLPRLLARASHGVLEAYGTESSFELAGEAHFLGARKYYSEADAIAPENPRVFRSLARLYASRDMWAPLQAIAQKFTRLVPADPWGWMTLGLTEQRLGQSPNALISLNNGMQRMEPSLRTHLDRLDRVLKPTDSAAYVKTDSAKREQMARYYWSVAEPLWSRAGEKPRTEFLARLAYAEIRYGSWGVNILGADTPKGQLYVRYGPPTLKRENFWLYPSGLVFAFQGTTWRAGLAMRDQEINSRIREWAPARWDNIAATHIDSMPIQVARFRASADSVDLFIATRAPADSLRDAAPVKADIIAKFWVMGLTAPDAHQDSLPVHGSGALQWTRRMKAGQYYYRVEAAIPDVNTAARSSALMMMNDDASTGFSMRGFGMSDIIVATRAEERSPPRRWRDLEISPVLASVPGTGEISLAWETYEAGERQGMATYDVAITVEHDADPSITGQVSARLTRGLTRAGQVIRKNANSLTFKFERSLAYAPVVVENVAIMLDRTPPGDYFVTVAVTDRVSGRTTSRTTGIVVR